MSDKALFIVLAGIAVALVLCTAMALLVPRALVRPVAPGCLNCGAGWRLDPFAAHDHRAPDLPGAGPPVLHVSCRRCNTAAFVPQPSPDKE